MITYQIKDWNTHFENNKSREREKCSFCCIPNKQDGLGYGMLMREPDGEALYAAFVAVVLICSKQTCGKRDSKGGWQSHRNGYITATGLPAECPLSARQLSVKCQLKEATIERMLKVISTNEIGWIVAVPAECPPSARRVPTDCPPSALEGKGIEGKEGEGIPPVKKLSASERISFEKELGRLAKELAQIGKASDYAHGSKTRKRIEELVARQVELRNFLGVKV